jgi:hypothetical protein
VIIVSKALPLNMKNKSTQIQELVNPFLGPDREILWDKVKKNAKPIKREELLQLVNSRRNSKK